MTASTASPAALTAPAAALLEVEELSVAFPTRTGMVLAVDHVSFRLDSGRTLGLMGESGCGKSMTLRAVLGLVPYPGEVITGSIRLAGHELRGLDASALRAVRGLQVSMVFQDPGASLDPIFTIGDQLSETLQIRTGLNRSAARRRSIELLDRVEIPSAEARLRDYPHQLSGGMRQRVMIALAIATSPRLLLADEPTTALDVTVQDQILDLLSEIQAETGMGIVLVSHDAGVIAQNSDEVAVMYAGHIVESGTATDVLRTPRHPYTRGLASAIPTLGARSHDSRLVPIEGQPPDIADLPVGCPFASRCPNVRPDCALVPMRLDVAAPGHGSACPFVGQVSS